jgi:oligopeptide transport system permease protein
VTRDAMQGPWRRGWQRFHQHQGGVVAAWLLGLIVAASLGADWIAPHDPTTQQLELAYSAPSADHLFGTDSVGRDLFARVLHGGRISLAVGIVATLVSLVIGVSWGMVAGWHGGGVDNIMMRIVDMLYSLPFMFFVILLVAWFGRSLLLLFAALGAVQWLTMSRIVRGEMKRLRDAEFVQAARAVGVGPLTLMLRHLLPNMLGPILVYATLTVPAVMLEEAFLSFLGLGVQPPMASWGSLANEGASAINALQSSWWLILFPGLFLSLTLLSLNFVGDALRDAFDPQRGGPH